MPKAKIYYTNIFLEERLRYSFYKQRLYKELKSIGDGLWVVSQVGLPPYGRSPWGREPTTRGLKFQIILIILWARWDSNPRHAA